MKPQSIALALLSTVASAAPTDKLVQSMPFYLSLTNQKIADHNGLRLEVIHVAAGTSVPVFRNPASFGTPAYFNDTRANIQGQHAYLDFDLGLTKKNIVPYSLSLPEPVTEKPAFVNVLPDQNTEEFGISHSDGQRLLYHYTLEEGAGLFACKETFDGGETHEIALMYAAPANFGVPKGCDKAEMVVNNVPKVDQ